MKIKKYINKKSTFIAYLIFILLIRLYLATGVRVWAFAENHYDDGMMLRDAANLIANNWLGTFDQYTLAKGITFPLYLALIHLIGIPFLFANVLMCFAASFLFIMVLRKIIQNKIALAVIYTVLMFNPIASASWTFNRAYRDSLYSYLVVILFSFIIAIYLNRKGTVSKNFLCSIGAGFFLSAVWLAREDSPWVAPFVVVALIITAYFILFDKQLKQKAMRLAVLAIIPILLVCSILTVSTINYIHYGVFMTNEYTGGYLPKLFKALTIIQPDEWIPQVPIPKSTREKAYEVSPTFAKLKPTLENHTFVVEGKGNATCSMLAWAVIDSVQWYGFKDAKSSQEFYKKSAEEINAAIKERKLPVRGGYIFMFESPWDNRYIKPLIKSLLETLHMTIYMASSPSSMPENIPEEYRNMFISEFGNKPLSGKNMESSGTNEQIRKLEYITNELAYYKGETIPKRQGKLNIANNISKIYYKVNPIIFIIGLLSYIYITLRFIFNIKNKKYCLRDEWIILTGLFLAYFLRLLLISYTDVCSIYMKYPMYLAPCYWLILMATFTSIFISVNDINKTFFKKILYKNKVVL